MNPAGERRDMAERTVVIFETDSVEAEERVLREYVLPAIERLESADICESVFFNRYGHDPSVGGGEVDFYAFGDAEAIRDSERDRWDELVEDGPAEEWWIDDTPVDSESFDPEKRLQIRLRATASRMAAAFFAEFEEDRPDALDTFDTGGEFGVGMTTLLHHLLNQLGYQADDGEEEIDICFENVRNRLYATAASTSVERATDKCETLTSELDGLPDELAEFRDAHGEHVHKYADSERDAGDTFSWESRG